MAPHHRQHCTNCIMATDDSIHEEELGLYPMLISTSMMRMVSSRWGWAMISLWVLPLIHNFKEIKALAPNPDVLTSLRKNFPNLERGLWLSSRKWDDCPKLLLWGKNNNKEWWNVNDFKNFCASYGHEVEGLLKTVSPYFPRGSKFEDNLLEPHTPASLARPCTSVSEFHAPWHAKVQRFEDAEN